jgi:hypothetical protein
MFFVEARYHRDPKRAAGQMHYIAHREEGLTDGRRRDLYGIGERYRALRGDEPAIRKALREDARGLKSPAYFRFILTVDNPTAQRFQRLDGFLSERVLRDAVEKTFRGAARGVQGVFAVHQHGGQDRPAHPHVHAVLSPRFENRMAVHISPVRIQRIKERWEREVLAGLERQERRLDRARDALARVSVPDQRDRDQQRLLPTRPHRATLRRDGQLELFAATRPVRLVSEKQNEGLDPRPVVRAQGVLPGILVASLEDPGHLLVAEWQRRRRRHLRGLYPLRRVLIEPLRRHAEREERF